MYTGTVQGNDDGSYTSSSGHTLTKGPDGHIYSGGASIGLSAGVGGGVVPTAWTGGETTSSFGTGALGGHARAATWVPGWWYSGRAHEPSLLALPIYIWMVFLGVLAGVAVSGSPAVASLGLHLHPVYGVAASVLVIGGYRYLMTVLPTALVVSLASSLVWATFVWAWRHPAAANAGPRPGRLGEVFTAVTGLATQALRSTLSAPDVWVVATGAVVVALHVMYWRHRRRMAKRVGWLFNRGLARAATTLLTLAATSGVLGLLLAWLG